MKRRKDAKRHPLAFWIFTIIWGGIVLWLAAAKVNPGRFSSLASRDPRPIPSPNPSLQSVSDSIQPNRPAGNPLSTPSPPATHPRPVLHEGTALFQPDLRQWASQTQFNPHARLQFKLLDGDTVTLKILRHDITEPDCGIIYGEAEDEPGSHVLLAYVGEAVAGTLFFPQRGLFQIRYAGEGIHRMVTLDPTWLASCGQTDLAPVPEDPLPIPAPSSNRRRLPLPSPMRSAGLAAESDSPSPVSAPVVEPTVSADAATTVEIFVAYTSAAKNANGGDSGIAALINAAIASANLAFNNSGAAVTLRLAGRAEMAYAESGSLGTDLSRFRTASDGHLDTMQPLRNNYKADLCSLIVHTGDYAGIAYLWSVGTSSAGFSGWAYSVVVDAYADSYLTLAHEVGHNFGCGHASGDGGSGAYSYSYGHRFMAGGTQYRTVMAYAPGTRIPYFSNPSVRYLGVNTGTSSANNVQTLNNSKAILAAIQTGSTLYQEWGPLAVADLNADSKADILWRNSSSGRVIAWLMDGTNTTSTASLWSGDANWIPITTGDFNSDNKPDIVWRNASSGRVIVWLMNGTTSTGTATLWTGDANWVPKAAADLNADGKTDLIWRHAVTGRVIAWLMNGTTTSSTTPLWNGDANWVPITTGDFNSDGKPDIVWRHASSGRVIVWFMNGTTSTGTATLWTGDASWSPVATGDFNADGKTDLVWRNASSGRVIIWILDGTNLISTQPIWG